MKDQSYLGAGELHIREYGAAAPFVSVGNCSAVTLSPQTNAITLADHTQPGGGERNRVDRITGVELAYTFHDFSPENFARALRGTLTKTVAGEIEDEPVVAYPGGVTPLRHIAAEIIAVEGAGGGDGYDEGVDFELLNGALVIPLDSAIPPPVNGQPNIRVSYAHAAQSTVQALVNPVKQYEMLFLGLNEAQSGKAVRIHAFKVSGGVIAQLALIGDEHGAGEVTGALQSDGRRGIGLSKYFEVKQEEVA